MARKLTIICAAVLALGLSGCDPEFCDGEVPDPIAAIFVGLLCSGRDPGPSTPPTASFTVEPSSVPNGGTVRLDASGSSDAESEIVRYEWDFDLFPLDFEVDGGEEPVREQRFLLRGFSADEQQTVRLQVTDQGGNTGMAERTITITGGGPVAAFTVTPTVPFVGESATFDASASTAALTYSWDLDGDGTFETGPSASPTVTHVVPDAGRAARSSCESRTRSSARQTRSARSTCAPRGR